MKVFPEANVEQYRRRLDERTDPAVLRSAPQRADHLARVGAILARADVNVGLDPDRATAAIATGRSRSGGTDGWEIRITAREFPQPVTDYSREAYDLLVQETLLVHEIGHLLYTDYDALRRATEGVDPGHRPAFGAVFDAAEDVAIEAQLRSRFSVARELAVLNANLFGAVEFDDAELSLLQAVELAILDLGVWETGRLEALVSRSAAGASRGRLSFRSPADARTFREEVLPLVRVLVAEMAATPDGEDRVLLVESFWQRLRDLLPEPDPDGGESDRDEPSPNDLKPDDADPDRQGEARPADALAEADGDREADEPDGAGGDESDADEGASAGSGSDEDRSASAEGTDAAGDHPSDSGTEDGSEPASGTAIGPDSDGADPFESAGEGEAERGSTGDRRASDGGGSRAGPGERDDPGAVDTLSDLEGTYESAARTTARSVRETRDALADDLEETIVALDGAADDFDGVELEVPTDPSGSYDESTYAEAERIARWVARELGDRLRQERRQRPRRRKRAGRLDDKRMTAWGRGDYRIFQRTKTGGEKDYNAMFVADRSASMGGRKVDVLERSLGGMVLALEEIGVRTAVMDLYRDQGRLVKPFGVPVDARRSLLFSGAIGGSTPLDEVLAVARERLDVEGGNRFLVLVTDGQVESPETFEAQVARCNFPVLGIYLATPYRNMAELTHLRPSYDYRRQLELFDRYRVVFDPTELDRVLEAFCREFMF